MDRDWDLAAVAVWRPNVAPVPIANDAARPGDMLTIAGYGSGNFRAQSGRCTQYLSPGPGLPFEMVEVHAAARHGDSGGPILNSRGELAGVLFGEGGGETSGSYCGRVRMFLSSLGGIGVPPMPQNTLVAAAGRPSLPMAAISPSSASSNVGALNVTPPPLVNPLAPPVQTDPARPGEEIVLNSNPTAATAQPATASIGAYPSTGADTVQFRSALPASQTTPSAAGSATADNAGGATGIPTAAAPGAVDRLTWEDIAGHTWGDQIKTVMAGLGILLLVLQVIRWVA
jgi:hypothetical protein